MLIYVNITDRRTDGQTHQKYSSEPHKTIMFLIGQTDRQTDTRTTQNYSSEPHKNTEKISITKKLKNFKIIEKTLKKITITKKLKNSKKNRKKH